MRKVYVKLEYLARSAQRARRFIFGLKQTARLFLLNLKYSFSVPPVCSVRSIKDLRESKVVDLKQNRHANPLEY